MFICCETSPYPERKRAYSRFEYLHVKFKIRNGKPQLFFFK